MKRKTAAKILNRYIKGLEVMEREATYNGMLQDAEHYRMDRKALELAKGIMEGKE